MGSLKPLVFYLNSNQKSLQNTSSYHVLYPDCSCWALAVQFKTFFKVCANQYWRINYLGMKKLSRWEKHDLKCLFWLFVLYFSCIAVQFSYTRTHMMQVFKGGLMACGLQEWAISVVACERNLIRMFISLPFTVIQPASLTLITCSHASPEASHPAPSPAWWSETSHLDGWCNGCFGQEFSVEKHLRRAHLHAYCLHIPIVQ